MSKNTRNTLLAQDTQYSFDFWCSAICSIKKKNANVNTASLEAIKKNDSEIYITLC